MYGKLLIALGVVVAILACARLFFRKKEIVRTSWEGAFRHIVAVMMGWTAFAFLFFITLVIGLFERDTFSFAAMMDALTNSLIILLCGVVIMFGSFWLFRKPQREVPPD
jgi:hypothetical protein